MKYRCNYKTPKEFSDIVMNSDGEYLTGLWFEDSKDALKHETDCVGKDLEIFRQTSKWLDIYFSGKVPDFTPKYRIKNISEFRREVIDILTGINYGETLTYGGIAKLLAKKRNIKRMSAQAVGGAVGSNPICIIVPCHRVIGLGGNLTGYGGGIENKIELLKLEGIDIKGLKLPKKEAR